MSATDEVGIIPCLIGAGAIQLGSGQCWEVRLDRRTADWDFAVRVDSWEQYDELSARLVAEENGFERATEPHRFRHRSGGILDVVPYGNVERPAGTIQWDQETEMDVTGFRVLEGHYETVRVDPARLRIAALPALVGLKLLSYRARRPAIRRDIADVHSILRDVEESVSDERVAEEALDRLDLEEVGFTEVGAYLLGRDVGRVFQPPDLDTMCVLLLEAETPGGSMTSDIQGSSSGTGVSREVIASRLLALRLGIVDR